jgi:uncharacterized protein (DUF4213/DUF364 family)
MGEGGTVAGRIVEALIPEAGKARVADVRLGLGYSAVMLEDGRLGVAYTFGGEKREGCEVFKGLRPLASRQASEILPLLVSADPLEATLGLACANALSNSGTDNLREGDVLDHLELEPEDAVAMIGNFAPLIGGLRKRVRSLTVFELIDEATDSLRPASEALEALPRHQVALVTSTSIINHTIDGILEAARGCREVALIGASTPLLPALLSGLGITLLSGIVACRPEGVLRVVSEGGGMRQFSPHVRKVVLR